MSVFVARNRSSAIEHINGRAEDTVDLDYESAWEDALELGRLGQQCGVVVQFRTVEHIAVESAEALATGLRREKVTFRQRYLYCRFDIAVVDDRRLCELEALAIGHGDYILPGSLLQEPTATWHD
jgi:hypothetical protein